MVKAKVLGARLQVPHPQQDLSLDFQGLSITHNQATRVLGLAWDPREDVATWNLNWLSVWK